MPKPGNPVHIPLETDEALRLLLKVKPAPEMPRPGATGKPKQKAKKRVKPSK